jgi:hypothetical protein
VVSLSFDLKCRFSLLRQPQTTRHPPKFRNDRPQATQDANSAAKNDAQIFFNRAISKGLNYSSFSLLPPFLKKWNDSVAELVRFLPVDSDKSPHRLVLFTPR